MLGVFVSIHPIRLVCPWSSLLRQPGGFEGVGSLHDAFDADHGSPSKGPNLEIPQLAERIALATGPVLVDVNDHAVSSVQELITGDHKTLPLWEEYLAHVPGHLVSAAVHPLPSSQAELRAQNQQDVRVIQLGSLVEVSAPPLTVDPPHDLDVLLGHRPRSISPGSAAFHAKGRIEIARLRGSH